jgi:osmotically-inducible protein OsmY
MTPASKRAFENFALASRVRATLALAEDLSQVRVEVDANDGDILVSGTVPEWVTARQVVTHIAAIPGIKQVRANLTTLPASLGMTS